MNIGRILLGGLAAGVVLNVGEFVLNGVIMAPEMKSMMAAHNFKEPGGSFMVAAILMTFVLAIVLVWLYTLIRSRLGPGPKTAIMAAIIMWFGVYLYTGVFNLLLFGVPLGSMVIAWVWGLIEYSIGAIVGAWLYKEA